MRPRLLALFTMFAALIVGASAASAQYLYDPDGRYSAGNPKYRYGSGVSPVPRTAVSYPNRYTPGTIIVNTTERRLYLVLSESQAIRYGIGVGRIGFTWTGTTAVAQKREWPGWTPPEQMRARMKGLPRFMKGGPDNPLGARAMYLGASLYRIHGSNEPETIGQAVSSGCFRLTNEDVIDLYDRVRLGAKVVVLR
jgi:lipoprotein-anchoring transpeptidase ErfK/SrfK